MFIHGLWLLPSSWDRWAALFADAGYGPVSPSWPDDPDTVVEANASPDVFADKTVGQVADHYSQVIGTLTRPPAVIGHSFGGLLAQILAGRGQSAATVASDAAPFRGVLPLPLSSLKAAFLVLGNPANHHRAVPLTYEQFRFAFANGVPEDEARQLYDTFAVPASGAPLFQAATANLNPRTEARMDDTEPQTAAGKVLWHFTMSLDGFVAGPAHDMDWLTGFAFRPGLIDEYIQTTGAVLAGRDGFDSAIGDARPYGGAWQGPIFVLTHHPENARPTDGITILSCPVEEAVQIALDAAGGKNVEVFSPTIGRQCSS